MLFRAALRSLLLLAPIFALAASQDLEVGPYSKRQLNANHVYPKVSTSKNESSSAASPSYSTEQLYSMTVDFIESFLWPRNQQQTNSINSTLLTEDVLGRVDVTRNFVGRQLNTEYIYGLFAGIRNNPDPKFFTLLGTPETYKLAHWAGLGNVVSFAVVEDLQVQATNEKVPFEVDVWLTFNHHHQVSQYDATFRYLQWALDSVAQQGMAALKMSNATAFQGLIAQKLATSICSIAQTSCNGTNQQYNSTQDCLEHLTTKVRYGQAYEMGMNTLLCRMVHQGMVPLSPDVHCSHIGKTGGAYCTDDRTYTQVVTQPYFNISSFVAGDMPSSSQM